MKRFLQTDIGGSLATAAVAGLIFGLVGFFPDRNWEAFARMGTYGAIFVFLTLWLNDKIHSWYRRKDSGQSKTESRK